MAKVVNAFDQKLDIMRRGAGSDSVDHHHVFDAAVYVHDTMELALAAAKTFAKSPKIEDVIAIYDRIEAERLRRMAPRRE